MGENGGEGRGERGENIESICLIRDCSRVRDKIRG
jgi:hypothetical protein